MLLQSYRERSKDQQDLSLEEYLTFYAEKIGQPPESFVSKAEKQQLEDRYLELKAQLENSVQKYSEILSQKKRVIEPYNDFKHLMAEKQVLTLKKMNTQLSAYQTTDKGEELSRIKKIIANGAWGCLEKLRQRISKLHELQNDANNV